MNKSKYFNTKEEFDNWILSATPSKTLNDVLFGALSEEQIIEKLIEDGYTDLNNLILDGHAYQIGDYTNNGWLYEDEADLAHLKATKTNIELRKRK